MHASQVCGSQLREVPLNLTVRAVEWHSVLHRQADSAALEACAPEGVQDLRSFTRSTIMDVLYYSSSAHGQLIIDCVASQLNEKHAAFAADRPGWRGRVSLLAHSLGSVIIADLLMHAGTTFHGIRFPKLDFEVDCVFAVGSPVPLYLVSRRTYRKQLTARRTSSASSASASASASAAPSVATGGAGPLAGQAGAAAQHALADARGRSYSESPPLPRCTSFFNFVNVNRSPGRPLSNRR